MITVIELRRYALHPGARDTLIDLFEREFVEPQEAAGMTLLGRFRDVDDPDAFVWLRGFRDMQRRREALAAFYGGPVWREHGPAASATMVAFDDVHLLRPLAPVAPVTAPAVTVTVRPRAGASADPAAGALAVFATLHAANTFPHLPVREGEDVVVTITADHDGAVGPGTMRLRSVTARARATAAG